jgi:hypothetical protein
VCAAFGDDGEIAAARKPALAPGSKKKRSVAAELPREIKPGLWPAVEKANLFRSKPSMRL